MAGQGKRLAKPGYPYARLKGMRELLDIIESEKTWRPSVIDVRTVKAHGISPKKESLVLGTLRFLGVITEAGTPTNEFEKLKADLATTLGRLVRRAYSPVFDTIPLGRMNQTTLVNFFAASGYSRDTAEYQAILFVWLCEQAEIRLPSVKSSFHRSRFDG